MSGFDFSYLLGILLSVIPSLLCITLHELSHGLAAYRLGDTTAKDMGRLTLNPIKHLDPMGLLMMLVFHVGWAKPVPVNMSRFRDPKKGMAITALAGPASNVLITLVFLMLYGALYIPLMRSTAGTYLLQMIQLTARMSLGLAIFNLLPVPPLDGSKILFSLLLFALMALGVLGRPLSALINTAYNALFPVAEGAFDLIRKLFYL